MSFLSTQNSELSSNLTRQHCLTPSTWEGDSRWAEWLTKLNGSLFKNPSEHTHRTHTHTHSKVSLRHTHTHTRAPTLHLLFSHCRGTVVHHSIEPTHHLLHLLPPSWGERQRGEGAGLMWNGNPIYSLNTLLPLLTEGVYGPGVFFFFPFSFFRLALRQAVQRG